MGDTEIHALRGIDLDLYAGEFAVMLGATGSGKSTLLNILGGLDSASGGEARYGDRDLVRADEQALTNYRRHVGFVFQSYNLISSLTARENVAIVTEISRDPMTPDEALELVGLSERLDHFPLATFWRRTTTGGHRSRERQAPGGTTVRRTHWRPRFENRCACAGYRPRRLGGERPRKCVHGILPLSRDELPPAAAGDTARDCALRCSTA